MYNLMPTKIPLHVVHVSGQDDNHKAIELNHHSPSTQGWQSGRFCLYPQDIVVQLEKRCRIRKLQILSHQYLIATKIEFYIGDMPEGLHPSLQSARYTRLGYIALADNEKTGFKARELKSVHVDAYGLYIKLVIHKNHVNRHNMYNQVGIVAINVIGEDIFNQPERNTDPRGFIRAYALDSNKMEDPSMQALLNKADFISPLDDLAFDMYQDPEVAQIIRKLDGKKQEAVLQERYEFAKKLKQTIQELQKAGEKLGKYDVEKRMAVANEDYDKAQIKKLQMDEYRISIYQEHGIQDLLEGSGSRYQGLPVKTERQPSPPAALPELTARSSNYSPPPPRTPYDDRPLPAIKHKTDGTAEPVAAPELRERNDERPLPTTSKPQPVHGFEDMPLPTRKPGGSTSKFWNMCSGTEVANVDEKPLPTTSEMQIAEDDRPLPTSQKTPTTSPHNAYDDRPLPSQKKKTASPFDDDRPLPTNKPNAKPSPFHDSNDDRPLPGSKAKAAKSPPQDDDDKPPSKAKPSPPRAHDVNDDRPLHVNKKKSTKADEDEEPDATGNVTGEPEPMSETDQREAALVIEVFGNPLAAKAYSKTWSFREDALLEVYRQMQSMPPTTPKEEARSAMRAATLLAVKGIKDKVFAVFTAALNLLRMLLVEFVPSHKIPKAETGATVEKTIPCLVQRSGDTAARIRDAAKSFIVEESKMPEVRTGKLRSSSHQMAKIPSSYHVPKISSREFPLNAVTTECVKPFKVSIAPRLALSRAEILHELYKEHKINNNGLTVENIMGFCTVAIQHNSGDVREKAEDIIKDLYRDEGAPVKTHLPPDDEKTRRNVLYKKLFEDFDKTDGKPSKDEIRGQKPEPEAKGKNVRQKAEAEEKKEKEIKELQGKLSQLKDITSGKQPLDESFLKDDPKKKKAAAAEKPKKLKTPVISDPSSKEGISASEESGFQPEQTCIFCGETNENFTAEGLDLHYWKSCPMLKRCAYCKQVEEISGLTGHLLNDCTAKDNFQKCPRCTEAIPKAEMEEHLKDKSDNPAQSGKNHCPLCHENFAGGEEAWKTHLMGKDGCKQNPRRTQNKAKGGSKGAKPGGKIPVKATPSKTTPRK